MKSEYFIEIILLKKNIFGWSWKIFIFFLDQKKVQKIFFHFIKKMMKNHDFWWFLIIFIDFSSFFEKYFLNFFLVEKKNEKCSTSSKTFFLSNIISMKYSDLNFYWNRVSRTWFARAIRSPGFWSKMSPGMSCSNGGDHMYEYWC